jgi:hypothetical protein
LFMGTPKDRLDDPFSLPLDAAAKWARIARAAHQSDAPSGLVPDPPRNDNGPPLVPAVESADGEAAIRRLRARRSLDPDLPPAPPLVLRRRSGLGLLGRLAGVIAAAAVIALFAIGAFPSLDSWSEPVPERKMDLAASSARPAPLIAANLAEPAHPRLVVQETRLTMGEPAPLGITLQGRADGAIVLITGLVPGMTLSMGGAVGADAWQVPATDLAKTWIVPPMNFAGVVALVAELRLPDDTVADRRSLYLEAVAAVAPAAPVAPARRAPAQRQTNPDEIAILLKRGEDFLAIGDVAAARVVLQRAAEARDAQAALVLAATYDPIVLRKMKVYGVSGDVALARAWYEKAKEYGSLEAPRRLEMLATAQRNEGRKPE